MSFFLVKHIVIRIFWWSYKSFVGTNISIIKVIGKLLRVGNLSLFYYTRIHKILGICLDKYY